MHVCEMKPQAEAVTPAMDVAVGDDYRHPCVQTTVHLEMQDWPNCTTADARTWAHFEHFEDGDLCTPQNANLGPDYCLLCEHFTVHSVHSVVVHWAFTSTSVMGNTIGTLISHCAKFFRWHILLVAHIVAHIACSSEAAEGGYELADGFPARGRRLSFWQRTDLWIHNAYVNPQMVPLDTSPDSAPLSCSGIFKDCTSFLICVCLKAHTNSAACVWSSWLIRPSQENVEKNDWPRVLGIY